MLPFYEDSPKAKHNIRQCVVRSKPSTLLLVKSTAWITPSSFSVLGLQGKECRAAVKCLGAKLADKRKRPYTKTEGFVNSSLAVALV